LAVGSELHQLDPPSFLNGSLQVGGLTFPIYRIFIVGATAVILLGVYLVFFKTSIGLQIRAVTQNRAMAGAMGISTRRIDAFTFAGGTALAGVAGCILGHIYPIKADMGISYVVDAFMVVILGGVAMVQSGRGARKVTVSCETAVEKAA